MELSTGAELRVTGPADAEAAVVCANGGQGGEIEGTWSASLEWLVTRLAPRFPDLAFAEVRYRIKSWKRLDWCVEDFFAEVRYRIKSWKRLDWCVEDLRAAITAASARRTLLVGFSM